MAGSFLSGSLALSRVLNGDASTIRKRAIEAPFQKVLPSSSIATVEFLAAFSASITSYRADFSSEEINLQHISSFIFFLASSISAT